MIVSIHQPNFIPWYPFFQKIEASDVFVLLGHCQFEKNNFQNRFNLNDKWHTMSVNKGLEPIVYKKYLNPEKDWNKIKTNLKQYRHILDALDDCISDNLFKTNVNVIRKLCSMLDIQTPIVLDYPTELTSTERLVDICKHYGATKYLSGPSGKKYLDLTQFGDTIEVVYQDTQDKKSVLKAFSNEL